MLIGINIINWLELKFRKKWLPYCTIAAIALIAYCNSFTVPFALDDFGSISNNYAIHKLFDFVELWKFYANRIVLYFTLSINYAIHDNGVEGYHITNLLLHIFDKKPDIAQVIQSLQICCLSRYNIFRHQQLSPLQYHQT